MSKSEFLLAVEADLQLRHVPFSQAGLREFFEGPHAATPALPLLRIPHPFAGEGVSTSTVACGRNADRCGQHIRCRR